jgi:hypothetical protein
MMKPQPSSLADRLIAWNARSSHIPMPVVSIVLGFFIAALVLAMAVPLMGRGTLRDWMVWGVILGCVLLVAGAQVIGHRLRR